MQSLRIKNILSLIFNILLVVLVFIAISEFFTEEGLHSGIGNMNAGGIKCFNFFTIDSNAFVALCALILIPFNIKSIITKNNEIPSWAITLKHIGTTAVTVTFMVVILFLGPIIGYKPMYENACLYLHLICPILAIISFCFFEKSIVLSKKQALLCILPTLIYGIIYLTNVIFINTWTDFYHFNIGGYWYISFVVMLIVTYIFALVLRFIHNKNI